MMRNGGMTAAIAVVSLGCAAPAYVPVKLVPHSPPEGIEYETGRLRAGEDLTLFERAWKPATGEVRGAVVIVHGLKDHSGRYAELAERLAARGFAVHALDLRGHGHSGGDRVWVDAFDDYLGDVDRFVETVQDRWPQRPVFVFGHSMGGAIVTLWTMQRTPHLAGLVLSGPALKRGSDVSGFLVFLTRVFGSVLPSLAVLDLPNDQFSRDPKVVAAMSEDPLVYQGSGPARTAKALLGALDEIDSRMDTVAVPLLVMHGTADTLTNPEGSKALHARAASTDKTLRLFEGLFHDLLHEPEKEEVLELVVSWIEARSPARSAEAE